MVLIGGLVILPPLWNIHVVSLGHKQKAGAASCRSNMKQLAAAFAAYAQDYDDHLPLAAFGPYGAGRPDGWVKNLGTEATPASDAAEGSLQRYMLGIGPFHCEADGTLFDLSYAANARLFPRTVSRGLRAGLRVRDAAMPATVFLLVEAGGRGQPVNDGLLFPDLEWPVARHNERTFAHGSVAFLDGHADLLRMDDNGPPIGFWNWNPTATPQGAHP